MRRDRLHRPASAAGNGRRMGIFAGGLIVACGVGYWTLQPRGGDTVPVVTADARPVRVRPADPGGLNVSQVGNFVFSGDSDDGESSLAAPPEAPNTNALRASERSHSKGTKPKGDHPSETSGSDTDG